MKEVYNAKKPVRVLMYGGTMDSKSYEHTRLYKEKGEPPSHVTVRKHSIVPTKLRATEHGKLCSFTQMEMKDSQKFTDEDIEGMLKAINSTQEKTVVITFGTDAMEDIARLVANRIYDSPLSDENKNAKEKTIVFTGAMEPLVHHKTDGADNLQLAVMGGLQLGHRPDAYVAMKNAQGISSMFKVDHELHKVRETVDGDGRKKRYFSGNTIPIDLAALLPNPFSRS